MPRMTTSWAWHARDVLSGERDLPGAGRGESRDGTQGGAFAGPVRADQRDHLAGVDGQRDALQRLDRAVVGMDVRNFEQGHHACFPRYASITPGSARTTAGSTFGDLLAVVEHGDALGDAHHDLHVVFDQQDRQLQVVPHRPHELRQRLGFLRVHAGRRLVEQQQSRPGRQRPGDLHPPLVSVRQVRGEPVEDGLTQADVGQQLAGVLARLEFLAAHPGWPEDRPEEPGPHPRVVPDHHVLDGRHRAEQADVLKGPGDAVLGDDVRPRVRDVSLAEQDPALGRPVQPGQHVEQSGLPRPVRADQRHDGVLRDVE